MAMNLTPLEMLIHSTVRIECTLVGGAISTGTGFFYAFAVEGERFISAIVTNKHVLAGAVSGRFSITLGASNGGPLVGQHVAISFDNVPGRRIDHPDPTVDLCVLAVSDLQNAATARGQSLFHVNLDHTLLPSNAEQAGLSAMEDVLMVGYPNGLWDATNNMPILRRGVTATHPRLDYNGTREFMIDAACFPGSSGSPVFLFNQGGFASQGNLVIGNRVKLLGVLYAGPQYTATGDIQVVNIPTATRPIALSRLMMNLGLVIKAQRIVEMDPLVRGLAV